MKKSTNSVSELVDTISKVSMIDLYQMLFVGLKLSGHIDWSWWVVMLPTATMFVALVVYAMIVAWNK